MRTARIFASGAEPISLGLGIYAPTYVAGPHCYLFKRVVATPYGPKLRRVTVCN